MEGEASGAPEPLAVGRAAQNGNWKVLRINIQVEELGRRAWVLGSPHSEGERGDSGSELHHTEGKEDM